MNKQNEKTKEKKQKSFSLPRKYYEDLQTLFKEVEDVCEVLQISSEIELLRVLARLGRRKFLKIVEEVRKAPKEKCAPED